MASKEPPEKHAQPRAPGLEKLFDYRALIRAPKRCSIRAPDSGPEKSYTIRAPKRWLVDTKTVASKEPLEKHAQPRAPGLEMLFDSAIRVPDSGPEKSYIIQAPKEWLELFDSGPDSGPEKLFHSGPGCGPRKGPRFGPRKVVYHSGPGFGPRKDVPFGPRVQHRGSKGQWGQWRNGSVPGLTCGCHRLGREVAGSNPACPLLCPVGGFNNSIAERSSGLVMWKV